MSDSGKTDHRKVLVIGLDGATFAYILPRMNAGQLPNLARVMEEGNWGNLLSTIPFFTMPAWSSFMTGKNPAKHGVISFFQRDPTGYDFEEAGKFANASQIRDATLWQLLSASGKRMGLINVPMTYPPSEVNGFMISGMLTPGKTSTYTFPASLADILSDYVIDLEYLRTEDHFDLSGIPNQEVLLADITHMLRKRGESSLRLMAEYRWDLFMTVFTSPDRICHFFWDYLDLDSPSDRVRDPEIEAGIEEYFRLLDQILGDMITLAGEDTTVLIVSDHGFGPAPTRRVNINNWLKDLGLLCLHKGVDRVTSLSYLNLWLGRNHKLKSLLKQILPTGVQQTIQERDRGKDSWLIDWSRTQAYCQPLYANVCGIGINQKGSKREGIVPPGPEYERLRDRLINEALKISDPSSGRLIVKAAYRREEVYEGKFIGSFPDIILIMDSDYFSSTSMMHSDLVMPNSRRHFIGDHRQEGIFIISGSHIRQGRLDHDINIVDIAPTILYLLGVGIPEDMDGKVPLEVFEESHARAVPPRYMPVQPESYLPEFADDEVYSDEEAEEIRERLKSLGYLG